jgi:16S rRNA (cytosine967-C5)-methyltransferase
MPAALANDAPRSRQHGPAGLPARRLAWEAVAEVLRRRGALDDALEDLAGRARLDARDEALARAIAVMTFRRFGTIRAALEERLAKGLPSDERALALLAVGAAQVLVLDVPDHAAVDLTVRLAQADRRVRHLAGVANAVLRRIARERDGILAGADPLRVDTPGWLAQRWTAAYGEDAARRIAAAHRNAASVDLTVKAGPEDWAARLNGSVLPTGSVRLLERTPVRELPGYEEGAWWVQDAAASLPARLLAARAGERIADLCAAPGGKTAQLASSGARVLAVDRSPRRLRRLAQNMARLRLSVEAREADVLDLDEEPFDAVLLDAPCTATGTIRRHPDVAWTKRADDLDALADGQHHLLDKAAALTRPGGRLVYCTCSLEPEESERQIEAFLARNDEFARLAVRPDEVGGLSEAVTPAGDLRTLPFHWSDTSEGRTGLDGFFAARLGRRATGRRDAPPLLWVNPPGGCRA